MRRPPDIRARARGGGFTLVELLVAVVLVALVMGVAIRGVRAFAKSDLRASAARMAGTLRYLFDRASTTGRIHRLVIEMETGKYWAEVSDDRYYMPRERETEESREREAEELAAEEEEEKQRQEQSFGDELVDPSRYMPEEFKPRRARFSAFKEIAVRPMQVKGARIASVYTPRLAEPQSAGKAYVYFFPLGLTEAALVHLSDEGQETFYTLVVHPLTGRVQIVNDYVEPPVDRQYDDEGNEIVHEAR